MIGKWYTIRYPDGTYPKQPSNKGDKVYFTDDIKRCYKYPSIPFLEKANYHDKERLKGCCIVFVNTGEIVEYIRVYDKLLDGITVLRETEKAIFTNTSDWIPKSQSQVIDGKIYVSDWFWKTKFENKVEEVV